ncbi:MAG TPA: 1-deoxy-D-xylulose-5-phosphate synthase [Gemmatimonadaceae bacterium]|jgi:1-deoxy-D-xylulose-5-phosphate synthase|nr:1-deoxy-D-xylulose-5-phosphate synthase [Gemmatimonadaceae bacterium]
MSLLDQIDSPADLRAMSRGELPALADEIRARLVDVCSRTGGHIGAGLGVVELTIALHYAFRTPRDQLVWDVGHQGYPHKLLTGRNSRMETLRQENGISGFLKRSESEYDTFGAGHAATAISAALGMAAARDINGEKDLKVVAVLGDGALSSGLAYEGLNNAGHSDRDVVVVLNDNEMSIAPNVGAMHKYLSSVQRNPLYNRMRTKIGELVDSAPGPVGAIVRKWEESVKTFLTPGVLFEELGFRYFGPIDGHDVDALVETFAMVRELGGPRLVHVITQKGKGFPAGEHAGGEKWHALPPGHDPATGKQLKSVVANPAYTTVFGKGLAQLGTENEKLVTITAAMPSGTGVGAFASAHPARFFDVGIAEGHAVTFAAGLATRGLRPVCAIYSTFLQRAYDNIIHDCAIQSLPVIFAMDRAGLVGEDGETHMGLYDIAYLLAVPNMTVTAPKDGREMLALLRAGLLHTSGPFSLRYPRDVVPAPVPDIAEIAPTPHATWEVMRHGSEVAILAVGTMVEHSLAAAQRLGADGLDVTVVNCRYLKPHDEVTLAAILANHRQILVVEEGTVVNGFGAYLSAIIERHDPTVRVHTHGVPDRIIYSAPRTKQLAMLGLDAAGIADRVRALHETEALAG